MTIDPGFQGTGIAVWESGTKWRELQSPSHCMNVTARLLGLEERGNKIASELRFQMRTWDVDEIFCEYPAHFESLKGRTSEAQGDIIKLAFLIGMFGGIALEERVPFKLVPVNEWKGQLPKTVVIQRIRDRLPDIDKLKITTHSWDAVGIGLYVKGYFKCYSHTKRRNRS